MLPELENEKEKKRKRLDVQFTSESLCVLSVRCGFKPTHPCDTGRHMDSVPSLLFSAWFTDTLSRLCSLQPIKQLTGWLTEFRAADHTNISANQNVTINIPRAHVHTHTHTHTHT